MTAARSAKDDDWLVLIDPQFVFASPEASPWGSPLFADALPRMVELAAAYGPERTVLTRFVANPGLGGSWASYYQDWPFALVPESTPCMPWSPPWRGSPI